MAAGGIYDQIGGGFARYSVDAIWLVPHFEKMLYDNALLARAYLHGYQALGHERWREVCERTLDWALREMRGPEGGFYSALDADSEGEEGKLLRLDAGRDSRGARDAGSASRRRRARLLRRHRARATSRAATSCTSSARPRASRRPRLDERGAALYEARSKRVWPGLDDKRLASWNALMIAALADAGAVLGRDDYLDAARDVRRVRARREMRDDDGRLLRTWKDGEARLNAYLEDHAYLVEALLALYEATFEVRWFDAARDTADAMIERFADPERGGFFTTSARPRAADRPPQGRRRPPDPVGQLRRRPTGCCGWRRSPASTPTPRRAESVLPPASAASRSATRRRSPTCCGRSTSTSPPVREVALVAPADGDGLGELAARRARRLPPARRPRGRPGGHRAARADARANRGRGRPRRRTSARTSPAGRPVTEPEQLAAALDG